MRTLLAIVAVSGLSVMGAGGCTSQKAAAYDAAMASPQPPEDFWVAVTVLRKPAEAASRAAAYDKLPVGVRPARYIVEADRVLRAATGSGANTTTFPDQTRQLTDAEFARLWELIRGSGLAKADNPAREGVWPGVNQIGDKTVYVVTFAAGGNRRVLAFDADPPGPGSEDAKKLVEGLAELAWVK